MYCPHCGNPVEELAVAAIAEEREPVEVTLARIAADQAIQVARIEASARRAEAAAAEVIAETEADATVDAAEVQADAITAALEQDDEPAPEPLEIIAPDLSTDVDIEQDDAPPPQEGSPVPTAPKKAGFGMW
jgi:hypothetical protein